jgi:hypothetical protein
MNSEKIKKIKDQLEKTLEKIVRESPEGQSPDFQNRILEVRRKILNKFGISESDYNSVEEQLSWQKTEAERQREETEKMDVSKEVFRAMQEIIATRRAMTEVPVEMKKMKEEIERLDRNPVKWSGILGKPDHVINPFDPKTIKGLKFNQLDHPDSDHREIITKIEDLYKRDTELENRIEKANQELTNRLTTIKINHGDLLGIGPDDHHQEKHALESHLDSDLMEKLIRLTKGGFVDDLHRHQIEMLPTQMVGGTTIGDVANTFIVNEEIGTGDDATVEFDLDYEPYNTSRIEIWVGTAKLFLTDDFTVSGKTITFLIAPPNGYKIRANYQRT